MSNKATPTTTKNAPKTTIVNKQAPVPGKTKPLNATSTVNALNNINIKNKIKNDEKIK